MVLKDYIKSRQELVDSYLKKYFSGKFLPERLYESLTYSLFAGGKRIRPVLAIASLEACGGKAEDILPQASAIELIHTYSLVHDDLPAMDDDAMRRGKPTNHKVFGEAIAILAGDALLTEAFVMFTEGERFSPYAVKEAIRILADAAGPRGMVGGQAEDILSERKDPDPRTVHFIHTHKTGALIWASVRIAPVLAESPREIIESLGIYGEKTGLAFQIVDDILDVTGDANSLGKETGADSEKGKMTYPAIYGIERSKAQANELVEEALSAIDFMGDGAAPLRSIAKYLVQRTR
ncbi:MAG TPA: polyprenyl synthetase family protein [Nitrospirae bacterium]|nr:polyprenyl synthetase family protein [Nitrospirota bacterium]